MKIFKVTYKGEWLGGKAIVQAKSAKQAVELVRQDQRTARFTDVEVEVIKCDPQEPKVLYNDDGDY